MVTIIFATGMEAHETLRQTDAKVILEKAPILLALPCMENAYDENCKFLSRAGRHKLVLFSYLGSIPFFYLAGKSYTKFKKE